MNNNIYFAEAQPVMRNVNLRKESVVHKRAFIGFRLVNSLRGYLFALSILFF